MTAPHGEPGHAVRDPEVLRITATADLGPEPAWSLVNDRRYAAYAATRLRFRPDVIHDPRPDDVMGIHVRPRRQTDRRPESDAQGLPLLQDQRLPDPA